MSAIHYSQMLCQLSYGEAIWIDLLCSAGNCRRPHVYISLSFTTLWSVSQKWNKKVGIKRKEAILSDIHFLSDTIDHTFIEIRFNWMTWPSFITEQKRSDVRTLHFKGLTTYFTGSSWRALHLSSILCRQSTLHKFQSVKVYNKSMHVSWDLPRVLSFTNLWNILVDGATWQKRIS